MARRSRAREASLQILYQDDLNPGSVRETMDGFLQSRLRGDDLVEFARSLIEGVRRTKTELDEVIARGAENWALNRIAATDRNILRLGAYEILHADTPGTVAIDEAIELAKRYGSAQSAQFVNGILDWILNEKG